MTCNNPPESGWMDILRADIRATGSIGKTAIRIGVSRPALSQILNGCGPYGSGKASTAKVEEKVMNTIGLVTCPFLTEYHGEERRITGLQCREHAYRTNPPTNVPREMQHWRTCQTCERRVKPAVIVAPIEHVKPARKIGRVGPVKNEIYGQAASGTDAETEGWETMGGPNDNPYPVEDSRSDYWEKGRVARLAFDRKERQRWAAEPQQAGVIDVVTLPLPEVGGPQVEEVPA